MRYDRHMETLQATRNRIWWDALRGALPGLMLAGMGGIALGIAAGLPFRLPTGRPAAGFVPTLIAGALLALGTLLALAGARRGAPASGLPARPGVMLCAAVLAFTLLLPPLGFLPAAALAGMLALLATPGLGLPRAMAGGVGLAGAAALLFLGLLDIPAPLFGPR